MGIDYQDLEIELGRCACRQREVRILDSPIDRPREPFEPGGRLAEVQPLLEELDASIICPEASPAERRQLAQTIGVKLYDLALTGKVRDTFEKSLVGLDARRESADVGLRLRFGFGSGDDYDPELVNLPWELLCEPKPPHAFFGREPQTPIVRYLELSKLVKPLVTRPPLKVLAILASPDHPKLECVDVARHKKVLKEAQRKGKWLELHFLEEPSLDKLHDTLDRHSQEGAPFHVLHFLGHGLFCEDVGRLCFEGADRSLQLVSGEELATQLAAFKALRLVVLATCSGAKLPRRNGGNPFTGVASALVAGRVPAVVAMQFTVSECAAAAFTSAFYKKIGNSRSVDLDEALVEGRLKILREDRDSVEWATPVLFLRSPDGRILDIREDKPQPKKIAVFNIRDLGQDELEVAYPVDLCDYFEVRKRRAYVTDPAHWNGGVMETLERTVNSRLRTDVPYHLVFAAPLSVAFAAGYLLPANSGHQIALVSQRNLRRGTDAWAFDGELSRSAPSWSETQADQEAAAALTLSADSPDVAVAVAVSRPVLPALGRYLGTAGGDPPRIGRLIYAVPDGGPGPTAVENGAHAEFLAGLLIRRIHDLLSARGRPKVHLFMAAPDGFAFALGRLSRVIPEIQLYEYDLTGGDDGTYKPSILLD